MCISFIYYCDLGRNDFYYTLLLLFKRNCYVNISFHGRNYLLFTYFEFVSCALSLPITMNKCTNLFYFIIYLPRMILLGFFSEFLLV